MSSTKTKKCPTKLRYQFLKKTVYFKNSCVRYVIKKVQKDPTLLHDSTFPLFFSYISWKYLKSTTYGPLKIKNLRELCVIKKVQNNLQFDKNKLSTKDRSPNIMQSYLFGLPLELLEISLLHLSELNNWLFWRMSSPHRFGEENKYLSLHAFGFGLMETGFVRA